MERQQRVLFHAQLLWSSQAAYELVRLVNESECRLIWWCYYNLEPQTTIKKHVFWWFLTISYLKSWFIIQLIANHEKWFFGVPEIYYMQLAGATFEPRSLKFKYFLLGKLTAIGLSMVRKKKGCKMWLSESIGGVKNRRSFECLKKHFGGRLKSRRFEIAQHSFWGLGACMTGWWFQICFIFTPIWGRFPFWRAYFSKGLVQPPARWECGNFTEGRSSMRCPFRECLKKNLRWDDSFFWASSWRAFCECVC